MFILLLIFWGLIVGSALVAFGSGAHALLGGSIRQLLRERSRSVLLFLSSMSLLAVSVSFLGLSDIRKDYAGTMLHLDNGIPIRSVLPDWARCELEWSIVGPAVIAIALAQLAMVLILARRSNESKLAVG